MISPALFALDPCHISIHNRWILFFHPRMDSPGLLTLWWTPRRRARKRGRAEMKGWVYFILFPYLTGVQMGPEVPKYAAPWDLGRNLSQKRHWERQLVIGSFCYWFTFSSAVHRLWSRLWFLAFPMFCVSNHILLLLWPLQVLSTEPQSELWPGLERADCASHGHFKRKAHAASGVPYLHFSQTSPPKQGPPPSALPVLRASQFTHVTKPETRESPLCLAS